MDSPSTVIGGGAFAINRSEMKNEELVVGASGFEPETSCAQGSCKKSILLVRLALFYVMVHGFGPNLAVLGPKLDPSFPNDWAAVARLNVFSEQDVFSADFPQRT